jgi:hypothetical protein
MESSAAMPNADEGDDDFEARLATLESFDDDFDGSGIEKDRSAPPWLLRVLPKSSIRPWLYTL